VLLPLALDVLLFLILVFAAVAWVDTLSPEFSEPWWGWIDWLRVAVAWSTRNLLRLVAVAAAFFSTLAVAGAVNAPFHDLLSEKTEDIALSVPEPGRPWSRFVSDALRALKAALLILLVQVAVMVPLFVLSFTAVGAPFFAAAGAWFAGMGLADIPMGRKRYGGTERIRWALRRWLLVMGLGVPVTLLPLLQPLAVVGATLLYLDQPEKEPGDAGVGPGGGDP
jgi:CysZ protein